MCVCVCVWGGGGVRDICFCFKNKHLVIIIITSMSVIIINDDRLKYRCSHCGLSIYRFHVNFSFIFLPFVSLYCISIGGLFDLPQTDAFRLLSARIIVISSIY